MGRPWCLRTCRYSEDNSPRECRYSELKKQTLESPTHRQYRTNHHNKINIRPSIHPLIGPRSKSKSYTKSNIGLIYQIGPTSPNGPRTNVHNHNWAQNTLSINSHTWPNNQLSINGPNSKPKNESPTGGVRWAYPPWYAGRTAMKRKRGSGLWPATRGVIKGYMGRNCNTQ